MWREDLILQRAEDSAKIGIREKSARQSLREWDAVSPSLPCGLCKGTPDRLSNHLKRKGCSDFID